MSSALLLATRSAGKLRELKPLFASRGIAVADLHENGIQETSFEDTLEAFDTFEENALAKARYFHSRSGRPAIADDSGLAVVALGGQPGVKSKRWSGRVDLDGQALDDENNRLLLERLRGAPDRRASYVCVAAFADGAHELTCRGETWGEIVDDPRGENGFGYDPYFLSSELGVTFGEATREAKEAVSHRGRAFRALIERLERERLVLR